MQAAGVAEDEADRPKDPPAVVDGVWMRGSVSQLQKADKASGGCLRKWRYAYIEKPVPRKEGAGQTRGKAGHRRLDKFYKTGDRSVLEHLELVGLQKGHIPEPHPLLRAEQTIWPEGGAPQLFALSIPMAGSIDLVDPRRIPTEGVLRLKDWKYKKPWNGKLGYSAEDLVNPLHEAGIQMIGYARWGLIAMPSAHTEVEHVTLQTAGRPDVISALAKMSAPEIEDKWDSISRRVVPKIQGAASADKPHDVEPNEKICEEYGGCEYKTICLDRMARIAAGFRKKAPTTQEAPVAGMMSQLLNPQAVTTPAAQPARALKVQDTAGTAIQGKAYVVDGKPAKFLCNTTLGADTFSSFMPLAGGAPILVPTGTVITELPPETPPIVKPPDAPASDPALAAKPAPGTLQPGGMTNPGTAPGTLPLAAVATTEAAQPSATVAGTTVTAPPSTGPAAESTPPPAAEPAKGKRRGKAETTTADEISGACYLYLNCSPVGVVSRTLHAYVEQLEKALYKQAQLEHFDIRCANDQVFGFGRWKGYLAKAATETPPEPGHYVVTTGGDERIDTVAQALLPISRSVIGGGR